MASPPGHSHPGRPLVALGIILLVLVGLVFFAGAHGSVRERLAPKLGLDLIGGTRVTLAATTPDGRARTRAASKRRVRSSRIVSTVWA